VSSAPLPPCDQLLTVEAAAERLSTSVRFIRRLRYARNGRMHAHSEVFATRAAAEWALWNMGRDGLADTNRWRPRSGVNDVGFAPSLGMLGDGCDSFFGLAGGVAGSADGGGRVEELAA